jgi:hypothetical protein
MDKKTADRVPQMSPAEKGTEETYDPQGSGLQHDSFFASVAPGVANSGNLAHKWSVEGDHSNGIEPPSGEKSE